MSAPGFWSALESLLASSRLVIDRARGSEHPRLRGLRYPYDYGYLEGTRSGDGQGVDVWVGSLQPPALTGVVCTADADKRDVELKLPLGCTAEERRAILAFHNTGRQAGILVERATAAARPAEPLASDRLLLRPFGEDDAAVLLEQWNQADVRRYLFDDEPVAASFVEQQIRASQACFAARGFGLFTIARRDAPARRSASPACGVSAPATGSSCCTRSSARPGAAATPRRRPRRSWATRSRRWGCWRSGRAPIRRTEPRSASWRGWA